MIEPHNEILHVNKKRNKVLMHAIWINLKNIMLRRVGVWGDSVTGTKEGHLMGRALGFNLLANSTAKKEILKNIIN